MNEQEFHRRWTNRATRYAGSAWTSEDLPIHILVDPGYAATYAGQVAAITAASLFGRMSKCVAVDVPSLPIVGPLPWAGTTLEEQVMRTLHASHMFGRYEQRQARSDDLRLVIGPYGDGLVIHGSGWGAFRGMARSPLVPSNDPNPYGAAFAVIDAAAQIQQHPSNAYVEPMTLDTYRWRVGDPLPEAPQMESPFDLGEMWSIGVGSVGSCALYFLGLITRSFSAVLVDADNVEIENITRSPLFSWPAALGEEPKVEVVSRWLREIGVNAIDPHTAWLDEIPDVWARRGQGTPDIVISAANERGVRSVIEGSCPPVQVYATTGRNWQATMFRHIPLRDACSRCVPGARVPQVSMLCATGSSVPESSSDAEDDIALPFLSYAAGLMTAAEITKLALFGRSDAPNRAFYEPRGRTLFGLSLSQNPNCPYHGQDAAHQAAIRGSRFASLSTSPAT